MRSRARQCQCQSEWRRRANARARAPTRCEDEAMRDAARDVHVWSRLRARRRRPSVRQSIRPAAFDERASGKVKRRHSNANATLDSVETDDRDDRRDAREESNDAIGHSERPSSVRDGNGRRRAASVRGESF